MVFCVFYFNQVFRSLKFINILSLFLFLLPFPDTLTNYFIFIFTGLCVWSYLCHFFFPDTFGGGSVGSANPIHPMSFRNQRRAVDFSYFLLSTKEWNDTYTNKTAWDFCQCTTEALKKHSVRNGMNMITQSYNYLIQHFNLN